MAFSTHNVNKMAHFTFIWTIENMSAPCFFDSPIFIVKQMEMTRWYLTVFAGDLDFLEVDIWREEEDGGPKAIEIKFELSVLGVDGLPLIENVDLKRVKKNDYVTFQKFVDKRDFFFRRRAEFLPKDELTIRCRMWRTGTDIDQIDSCFARTRLTPDRHCFVWAIRDFIAHQKDHEKKILLSNSPTFKVTLNLKVTQNNGEEYISISMKACDYDWTNVKISLLDFEGKVVHAIEKSGDCDDDFQFENFIAKEKLINNAISLLPNDVLALRCEIEMDAETVWSKIENYIHFNWKSSPSDEGGVPHLMQDGASDETSSFTEAMRSLTEDGTLSDVRLRTDSRSFPAHKCLLSARSPFFKAMFGKYVKKTSKCVVIPDVVEDTLEELLFYIYTGRVVKIDWRRAADLYKKADRYKLLDLKRKCAALLKSNLSVSSVCDIWSVADMHQDTELLVAAEDFFVEHWPEIFTTDAWRIFKEENSLLAFGILEQIIWNIKGE